MIYLFSFMYDLLNENYVINLRENKMINKEKYIVNMNANDRNGLINVRSNRNKLFNYNLKFISFYAFPILHQIINTL
jgi:hypothetical protein